SNLERPEDAEAERHRGPTLPHRDSACKQGFYRPYTAPDRPVTGADHSPHRTATGGEMNSKLRNSTVALGVAAAFTVAVLLATGTGMTPAKNKTDGAPVTSPTLPPALGRSEEELPAGPEVLDLVALDTAGTGPALLPRIAITLPSGWSNYEGYAVNTARLGLAFWDV